MQGPLQLATHTACHRWSLAKQKKHRTRRIWLPEIAVLPSDVIVANSTRGKPEKPTLLLYRGGTLTRLDADHRWRGAGRGPTAQDLEVDEGNMRVERGRR